MNWFEFIGTDDALTASKRVLVLQCAFWVERWRQDAPLEPTPLGDAVLDAIANGDVPDTPRLRLWLTATKELLRARRQGRDPPASAISHLFVDRPTANRIWQLHMFDALGLWLTNKAEFGGQRQCLLLPWPPPARLDIGELRRVALPSCPSDDSGWSLRSVAGTWELHNSDGAFVLTLGVSDTGSGNDGPLDPTDRSILVPTPAGIFSLPLYNDTLCTFERTSSPIIRSRFGVGQFCRNLACATELIDAVMPGIAAQCHKLAPFVLPLHNSASSFASASSEEILGVVYLPCVDSVVDLAECLIHEAMHQKLFRVELAAPLFIKDSANEERYYSPWRNDPRPLRMVMHGAFVFAAIADFHLARAAKTTASPAARDEMREVAGHRAKQAAFAIATVLRHAALTPLGEKIAFGLERHIARVLASVTANGKLSARTEARLQEHRARFCNYVA